jgi:asparagine synthetase B (glutamine-hydrolysing)
MCGFVALFEPGRLFAPPLLDGLGADVAHRGPDSAGQTSERGLALVFRRLAIMDPGHGADQPTTDARGRYSIVFNGEIYNFRRLRRELEQAGAVFCTAGDTKVILAGWAHWGEALLDRLEGMFAFVLVDGQARVPFTHVPLFRLVNALPDEVRFPDEGTKTLLKKVAERYLPHDRLYRRKVGLALPLRQWLKDDIALGRYLELLADPNSRLAQFSRGDRLRKAVEDFRAVRWHCRSNISSAPSFCYVTLSSHPPAPRASLSDAV